MVRACALASILLLPACYRYVPARPETLEAGQGVRIHLSDAGASRLSSFPGASGGEIDGDLLEWGEQVVVSVAVPAAEGVTDRELRNRMVVPRDDIVGVELRERDRLRTTILVGGMTAAVSTAVIAAVTGVFGGRERTEDPGEEEGARFPFWPWSLTRPSR